MASVYLAQASGAHGFEKWVAVKVIHPHLVGERRFVEMFLDEARVFAPLLHPNVCAILDFGEEDGQPYLVMEYLHGESFAAVVRRARSVDGGLPVGIAARVIAEAARGLHAAHELRDAQGQLLGVVHRDVSPQNVFVLYDGGIKVVDFGVARARNRLTTTVPGEFKGKLSYAAPELLGNGTVDRRADVFSLGVVLWESLTLRRLFRRESEAETMAAVLSDSVPPLSRMGVKVPPALEEAVAKALQRDPDARHATAKELADDLETVLYALGAPWGASQITAWMQTAFRERIDSATQMLRSVRGDATDSSSLDLPQSGSSFVSALRRRQRPIRQVALVVAVLSCVLLLGWLLGRGSNEAPALRATPMASSPRAGEAGVPAAPAASRPSAPPVRPEPSAPPAEPPVAPSEPPAAPVSPGRPSSGAAEQVAPGFLNLLSVPVADVFLGARHLGRTPLLHVPLRPGRQTLRLRSVDRQRQSTVTVEIRSGRVVARSVRLQ